jgi:hypothetical protein
VTAPIKVRVTRYQDPHCGRTHSSRRRAEEHMARCWRNPDARGCLTCAHFQPFQPSELDTGWPGEPEHCTAGVDLTGRPACTECVGGKVGEIWDDEGVRACPACHGDHDAVKAGPIVHCDLWQLNPERQAPT